MSIIFMWRIRAHNYGRHSNSLAEVIYILVKDNVLCLPCLLGYDGCRDSHLQA